MLPCLFAVLLGHGDNLRLQGFPSPPLHAGGRVRGLPAPARQPRRHARQRAGAQLQREQHGQILVLHRNRTHHIAVRSYHTTCDHRKVGSAGGRESILPSDPLKRQEDVGRNVLHIRYEEWGVGFSNQPLYKTSNGSASNPVALAQEMKEPWMFELVGVRHYPSPCPQRVLKSLAFHPGKEGTINHEFNKNACLNNLVDKIISSLFAIRINCPYFVTHRWAVWARRRRASSMRIQSTLYDKTKLSRWGETKQGLYKKNTKILSC